MKARQKLVLVTEEKNIWMQEIVDICVPNDGARLLFECIVGQVHAKIVQVGMNLG